jgi:DNA polymerase III delta prime subunit
LERGCVRDRRLNSGFPPSQGGKDDGSDKRALLLSGPPGIGKTTASHVVAHEAGYEVVELNASDVRSKKSLELHIADLVGNKTVSGIYRSADRPSEVRSHAAFPGPQPMWGLTVRLNSALALSAL